MNQAITSTKIASALRKADIQCTATHINYLWGYDSSYTKMAGMHRARPIHSSGSGKWSGYSTDYILMFTGILDSMGVAYVIGNDAPRGGKLGKYVDYDVTEFYARLKYLTGLDIPGVRADYDARVEAVRLEDERKKAAIETEAAQIVVDDKFYDDIENGGFEPDSIIARSEAFKALLSRNGKTKIESDFWKVFKIVYARNKK